MSNSLFLTDSIVEPPLVFLERIGTIFSVFDASTQDSGNISYGVRVDENRYFVKTAGLPNIKAHLEHDDRVSLLRNAIALSKSCSHPTLVKLLHVIEGSHHGPMLVYEWIDGELLNTPRDRRNDPASVYQRFRNLSVSEIIDALDSIFDLHRDLANSGWIACDFYDGSMLYDFESKSMRVIDLDMYHFGEFTNTVGEMPGSSRFMAPEEKTTGALITQRTNVYTLGRVMAEFLPDGTLDRAPFRGSDQLFSVMQHACMQSPHNRHTTVSDFHADWRKAI